MKVISLIGQKGGAGKSTMTRVLLSAMVADGKHVLLIDSDPNRSTMAFAESLAENDPDSAAFVSAHHCLSTEDIEELIDKAHASGKVDYCLIDTQGDLEVWVDEVIALSDRIIIPLKVSKTDFSAQMATYNRYMSLKEAVENPEDLPPICFVLNQIKPGIKYPKALSEQFFQMAEHPAMLRVFVSDKNVYNTTDNGILLGEMMKRLQENKQPARYVGDALEEARTLLRAVMNVDVVGAEEPVDG